MAVLSRFKVQFVYTGGETEVDHQNPSRHLEGDISNKMLGTVCPLPTGPVEIMAEKNYCGTQDTFFS